MDADRFDRLVLTLTRTRTRRSVLGLLAALGLTGLVTEVVLAACAANGTRCGRAGDLPCCSGWCKRKRGTNKRFCRQAPGQGTCTIENDACVAGGLRTCNEVNTGTCGCYVTSQGYSFCADPPATCYACQSNVDCETRPPDQSGPGQPGDRCVQCSVACGSAFNNRACVRTCPNPATG